MNIPQLHQRTSGSTAFLTPKRILASKDFESLIPALHCVCAHMDVVVMSTQYLKEQRRPENRLDLFPALHFNGPGLESGR